MSDDMVLIPYVEINGAWTINDETMKRLYGLMVAEQTNEIVFKAGSVMDEDDFIKAFKSPNVHMVLILTDTAPAAIVWIRDFGPNYAYGHFCMFKNIWGKKTIQAGQTAIDYFFSMKRPDGEPFFDLLIGVFPEDNEHALNLVKNLGFTVLGVIPKMLYDKYENRKIGAVYSYIERRK